MSLRELYQEMIIDHGKAPRNFGKLQDANHSQVGHNPLCGDRLIIYVKINDNEMIEEICFEGSGCAISLASASLMTECMRGKKITEMKEWFEAFHVLVTEAKIPSFNMGKLAVFAGVSEFPIRVKCATLAWHTLKAAVFNELQPVKTEE